MGVITQGSRVMKHKQNAREQGRVILAHGEVTGHCHEVVTEAGVPPSMEAAQFFDDPEHGRVLLLVAPAIVRHDEHAPLALDPGKQEQVRQGDVLLTPIGGGAWKVTRQLEWEPDGWRQVAD